MHLSKKFGVYGIMLGLIVAFGITTVFAQPEAQAPAESSLETFQATPVCLGCTLKKEQGAKALCSVFGHKNALRTEDSKIWTILENEASAELINLHEYAGKKIEITGKKFADAQVIEVSSFKALEKKTAEHPSSEHPR